MKRKEKFREKRKVQKKEKERKKRDTAMHNLGRDSECC